MVLGWIAAGSLATLGATGGGLALNAHRTRTRVERELPPHGRMVDAGGHRFHVVESGEGPPVLLIHGLGGQSRNFHALMPELARDHHVVAIDRPGSGYSPRGKGVGGGPIEQADAIAGLIDALNLDRPVVVGHSLGGAVALALGLDHPDKVGGLALICPATQPIEKAPEMFRRLIIRSDLVRHLVGWTVAAPLAVRNAPETLRTVFAPEPVPPEFATEAGGYLSLRPQAFRNASLDTVSAPADLASMAPRYGELGVPAAIMFGREDKVLDPELHGRGAEAKGIPMTVCEGGHMLPITRAPAVADWVRGLEREWAATDPAAVQAAPAQ